MMIQTEGLFSVSRGAMTHSLGRHQTLLVWARRGRTRRVSNGNHSDGPDGGSNCLNNRGRLL